MNLLTNVERMFEGAQGDILCASGVIFDTFCTETPAGLLYGGNARSWRMKRK